ncbi:PPC domain-containing protein [Actinoplanes subglobosus]|uniref:PPC domain-containing protein n=1 Tax=Actinoplanes subglobosus TaxID=1547892 RepID=A0ABV8J1M3_9ACTN
MRILRRLSAALTAAVVIVSLSGAASHPFPGYDTRRLTLGAEAVSTNRAIFEVTEGDRLAVVLRRGTIPADTRPEVVVRTPDGTEAARSPWSETLAVATFNVWTSGTWSAEVVSPGSGTGTLQLVGSTRRTTTVNGTPITLRVTKPGERAYVTFPVTAGRSFTVAARSEDQVAEWDLDLTVRDPGGHDLGTLEEPDLESSASSRDLTAAATGTYSMELTGSDDTVGAVTVFVTSPAEPKSVTVNGPDAQLTLTKPGERALLAVPATAGQRLTVVARAAGMADVRLLRLGVQGPGGSPESLQGAEGRQSWTAVGFLAHRTGTHLITVDPEGWSTGRVDVAVLQPVTVTAKAGGPAVELNLDRPGRTGTVVVTTGAGEHLTALITSADVEPAGEHTDVVIRSPYRSVIGSASLGAGVRADYGDAAFTTRTAGAQTIEIIPGGALTDSLPTGRYTVRVAGSSTVAAKVGGPAVTARTPTPGGRAFVRFDAAAGQWLDLVVRPEKATGETGDLALIAPDGDELDRYSYDAVADTEGTKISFTAPAAGTYLLAADPYEDRAGAVTVRITEHQVRGPAPDPPEAF